MTYSASELKTLRSAARILERHAKRQATENETTATSPAEARKMVQYRVALKEHEEFGMLYLNNQHGLLGVEEIFRGTIDAAAVYPREVVKSALVMNSAAVIFYHNHPSGNAEPSQADIQITKRLKTALNAVDIRVLDHFVVTAGAVVSFAERGLL